MDKKVNITLNCFYYGFYLLIVAAAVLMWYLLVKTQQITAVDKMSGLGQAVQYIVICYAIVSVAGGLYGFKKLLGMVKQKYSGEALLINYRNLGIARICLIGIGAVLGIATFYWLGGYTSMLWCAGISVIGLYFCKPTQRKMEIELSDNTDQQY